MMADQAEAGDSPAHVTFKVKTSSDTTHTVTMAESASVLDLKTKLSAPDLENVPVDRQRLIYSGRVMKNDNALATYKINPNNTVHMVKSAASNPSPPPNAVPSNMASGTANNPLAGLTGARYAGHQVNLPGMDMFGPDGGVSLAPSRRAPPRPLTCSSQMDPPMDEERLQHVMSDPNMQSAMREALNNPDFVNMLIESNPMLRNMPGARELITSPGLQQMMSNTNMLRDAMRLQRIMGGAEAAFPAPGATDTTPDAAAPGDGASNNASNQLPALINSPAFLSSMMRLYAPDGTGNAQGASPTAQAQNAPEGQAAASGSGAAPSSHGQGANPFAALFPTQAGAQGNNPFGMTPEMMQQMMQMMGGAAHAEAPPDNRPPEERYADQLRQLNDMGFFDFDRNVAALRRSGGSVQGAVEHLLSATD